VDFPSADADARVGEFDEMNMRSVNQQMTSRCEMSSAIGVAMMLATILVPSVAWADGGVVRAREAQGPFLVTIFSPAEISTAIVTDVTVMVQRRQSDDVVMDAIVDLTFTPPPGASTQPDEMRGGNCCCMSALSGDAQPGQPLSLRATRAQAANKLLYGVSANLAAVGDWQLRASVRHGNEQASVMCTLAVAKPPRQAAAILPYIVLPPLTIALFATNQWLKRRRAPSVPHQGELRTTPQ
jgi:hypothetical protein